MLPGNELANRARRFRSQPVQQLRAAAGLVLDWFRACLRNGWLGSHKRRNKNVPIPYRDGSYLKAVLDARDRHALAMPYGEKAVDLGLTDDPRPPGQMFKTERKKRRSKAPPG